MIPHPETDTWKEKLNQMTRERERERERKREREGEKDQKSAMTVLYFHLYLT